MYEHLGKMAICNAFYKKIKDGIYIECYDKDRGFCWSSKQPIVYASAMKAGKEIKELDFEGDGIEKTLYELQHKKFSGVCVGEVQLPITELLYADFTYDHRCEEIRFIAKEIKQSCECYVIYFANNRKRYVPKDCCVFVDLF